MFQIDIFVANSFGENQCVSNRAHGGNPIPWNHPLIIHKIPSVKTAELRPKKMFTSAEQSSQNAEESGEQGEQTIADEIVANALLEIEELHHHAGIFGLEHTVKRVYTCGFVARCEDNCQARALCSDRKLVDGNVGDRGRVFAETE